ncbi:hypothetical protein FHS56_002087 [Thermonema lapsum]|uniref:Uncharacterized protein n=1 Tax=Thermonema lapsum TaxID=28195 RepID=A0A846MTA9_9BACT|nr:hypothetical protein [Thermonema lapsum]
MWQINAIVQAGDKRKRINTCFHEWLYDSHKQLLDFSHSLRGEQGGCCPRAGHIPQFVFFPDCLFYHKNKKAQAQGQWFNLF